MTKLFVISAHSNYSPSDADSLISGYDQPHLVTDHSWCNDTDDTLHMMPGRVLRPNWAPEHLSHSELPHTGPQITRQPPVPGAGTREENGQRERLRDVIQRPEQITQRSWALRVCTFWGLPSSWRGYDCTLQAISTIFNSTSLLAINQFGRKS